MGSSPKTGTSSAVIRVLTVDDHALIREGIAALIANQKAVSYTHLTLPTIYSV